MTVAVYERQEAIDLFLDTKEKKLNSQWKHDILTKSLDIQAEPASAKFVKPYTFMRVLGILNDASPIHARVLAQVKPHYRDETKKVIKKLDELKIDRVGLGRCGGPYLSNYPTKRVQNWLRYKRTLITSAVSYFHLPWWEEIGRDKYIWTLEYFLTRTLRNMERIDADPHLIVGEKLPTTGTGYVPPINDRAGMEKNFRYKRGLLESEVTNWYTSNIELLRQWPNRGGVISVGALFKGVKGSRSDATIKKIDPGEVYTLEIDTREVGTTPPSCFHNQKLNTRAENETLWRDVSAPEALLPYHKPSYIQAFSVPPITADFAHEQTCDRYNLGADFGYTDGILDITPKGAVRQNETVKFGADQVVQSGIYMRTSFGDMYAQLMSGCPETMVQYQIMGWGLHAAARDLGISFQYLGVGDDWQILGTYDALMVLSKAVGPYLRTKGMSGNTVFILGHYVHWIDEDHIIAFVIPRPIRTVASPKQAAGVGSVEVGKNYRVWVRQRAIEQEDKEWKDHGNYQFFEGSLGDWKAYLAARFVQDKMRAAQSQEVSDWFTMFNPGVDIE